MTDEEMAAAYKSGKTIKDIAAQQRWSQGRTHKHLQALGVELRPPGGRNNHLAVRNERLERNAALVASGRVKVFTPEQCKALEAERRGGGK